MKLTAFLLFVLFFQVSAGVFSQNNGNLTLKAEKESVNSILKLIEEKSEYRFLFNSSNIDVERKTDINVDSKNIEEVLKQLFEGTDVKFHSFNDNYVLYDENGISPVSNQQQKSISGKVTDTTGAGVPGVSVVIKGTTSGTITDANGNYSITKVPENATLLFSMIGMQSREIAVADQTSINISLTEISYGLNEVVAIGYGTVKKRDLTGAMSHVNSDEIKKNSVIGIDQALQGRVAGVQVTNNSGEPGGSVSVRIRGVGSINSTSEPLYVVDGIPLGAGQGLNSINTADIESIDVMKDASSGAIYGSRAANGVVIITTKRGVEGKPMITFDAYYGLSSPEKYYKMANTTQFVELSNEAYTNTKNDPRYQNIAVPSPNPDWQDTNSLPNTDWQRELFRTANVSSYNLNVAGGTKNLKSALGIGYLNQEGIILNSFYERYTLRANSDYTVNSKLNIGASINLSHEYKKSIKTERDWDGTIQLAYYMPPLMNVYNEKEGVSGNNNEFFGYKGYNFMNASMPPAQTNYYNGYINPVYQANEADNAYDKILSVIGSVYAEYEIVKGLKFRSSASINTRNTINQWLTAKVPVEVQKNYTHELYRTMYPTLTWNAINTLTYKQTFGKHDLTLMAGTDAMKSTWETMQGNASNFINPEVISLNTGANKAAASGYTDESSSMSYMGRVNYILSDKYIFTFNYRYDGSSKFGPDKQWGSFPSMAAAWRISNEDYFNVDWISDLKLRASWGLVGNAQIPDGLFLNTYSTQDEAASWSYYPLQYSFGPAGSQANVNGIEAKNLANKDIKWEASEQMNVGFDMALLNNRVTITGEYYIKEINDMLGYEPVPSTFGAPGNSRFYNFASMTNKGLELDVKYKQKIGKVNMVYGANFSTLKNEVTNIGLSKEIINGQYRNGATTRTVVGESIGYLYGYLTDGIFQNQAEIDAAPTHASVVPGDIRFKDVSGPEGIPDGVIDPRDRVNLGSGLPKYLFGLNIAADYKNFDLSVFIQGQAGVKVANNMKFHTYNIKNFNGTGLVNVAEDLYDNRWHGEGTSNTLPRVAYNPSSSNSLFSDFYVEDAAFVRLKSIQLGYTLTPNMISKYGLQSLRMYVSAQNLFTFTKYSGLDPEVGSRNQQSTSTGVDNGRYPLSRSFSLGLNLSF